MNLLGRTVVEFSLIGFQTCPLENLCSLIYPLQIQTECAFVKLILLEHPTVSEFQPPSCRFEVRLKNSRNHPPSSWAKSETDPRHHAWRLLHIYSTNCFSSQCSHMVSLCLIWQQNISAENVQYEASMSLLCVAVGNGTEVFRFITGFGLDGFWGCCRTSQLISFYVSLGQG